MTEPSQYFKGRTVQEQMNEVIGYVDTRAAEVATDAIASDVAQVHQDMLDADADASAAAASAAAAAGTLANAVKKTGESSQSIAGDIAVSGNLSGGSVTVPTPVNNTDAANKKYVDDKDALDVHLAGAETITGVKQVPLETTGTFSNQIASSNKVKNELDNYTTMVRTANAQTIGGIKTFTSGIEIGTTSVTGARIDAFGATGSGNRKINVIGVGDTFESVPATFKQYSFVSWSDENGRMVAGLRAIHNNDGTYSMQLMVLNSNGTEKYITLGKGDVI